MNVRTLVINVRMLAENILRSNVKLITFERLRQNILRSNVNRHNVRTYM